MDRTILKELIRLDIADPVDRVLALRLVLKLTNPIPLRLALSLRDEQVWYNTLAIALDEFDVRENQTSNS